MGAEKTETPKPETPKTAAVRSVPLPSGQVLVRVGGPDEAPDLRPAIVTRAHSATCVNAMVFLDGPNDAAVELPGEHGRGHPGIRWCASLDRGDDIGQWRFPS